MRQRRQVTTRSHAALGRHERRDFPIQHLTNCVDHNRAHARMALREGVGAQQHHGSSFSNRQRLSHSDCVRTDKVDLQFANLVARDTHVTELANTGGNRIGKMIARNQRVHHRACALHSFARIGRQQHGTAVTRDLAHSFKRQVVSVDVQCFHKSSY